LHSEECHNLYSSPNVIRVVKSRKMRRAERVTHMGDMINSCEILIGKPEGKRQLVRPRRRWEDNIRMDVKEIG